MNPGATRGYGDRLTLIEFNVCIIAFPANAAGATRLQMRGTCFDSLALAALVSPAPTRTNRLRYSILHHALFSIIYEDKTRQAGTLRSKPYPYVAKILQNRELRDLKRHMPSQPAQMGFPNTRSEEYVLSACTYCVDNAPFFVSSSTLHQIIYGGSKENILTTFLKLFQAGIQKCLIWRLHPIPTRCGLNNFLRSHRTCSPSLVKICHEWQPVCCLPYSINCVSAACFDSSSLLVSSPLPFLSFTPRLYDFDAKRALRVYHFAALGGGEIIMRLIFAPSIRCVSLTLYVSADLCELRSPVFHVHWYGRPV